MCSYKNNILQLAFGVVLGLSQGIAQAADYVDVLDLPARVSALAINSPLSGMTRAGAHIGVPDVQTLRRAGHVGASCGEGACPRLSAQHSQDLRYIGNFGAASQPNGGKPPRHSSLPHDLHGARFERQAHGCVSRRGFPKRTQYVFV